MIVALDVHYRDDSADVACAGIEQWSDATSAFELVQRSPAPPEAYESGQFYKRELPHLLHIVRAARQSVAIDVIVVDGHVWLKPNEAGLGAHLFVALNEAVPVAIRAEQNTQELPSFIRRLTLHMCWPGFFCSQRRLRTSGSRCKRRSSRSRRALPSAQTSLTAKSR